LLSSQLADCKSLHSLYSYRTCFGTVVSSRAATLRRATCCRDGSRPPHCCAPACYRSWSLRISTRVFDFHRITTLTADSVCIVSILRLQSLVSISNSRDPTYDNPPAATWSSVESNVGIICSCLPLLRPLVARWVPSAFPSRRRSIHSSPRHQGGSKALRVKNDYTLEATQRSQRSSDDARDIQVVTDIHVSVEDGEGRMSGWKTPTSNKEWGTDGASSRGDVERASSTEMLV
jgi:hypothetical protein